MIETIIEKKAWRQSLGDADALAARCAAGVAECDPALIGDVALLLTDDAALKSMNAQFRGQDKPTNVLAFPAEGVDGFLGDIAMAYETCAREASEKNIAITDHAAHLMVHGMLHLIGYDHQEAADADVMEACETKILASLGIRDPYADAMETLS